MDVSSLVVLANHITSSEDAFRSGSRMSKGPVALEKMMPSALATANVEPGRDFAASYRAA